MKTVQFPDKELVAEQAATWVAMIDRGMNSEEERDLNVWLSQSPLHGESLIQLASTWDLLDILTPIAKLMPLEDNEEISSAVQSQRESVIPIVNGDTASASSAWVNSGRFAIAACVGLLAIVVLFKFNSPTYQQVIQQTALPATAQDGVAQRIEQSSPQTYVTEIGEQATIRLEDGSEIKLNTDSQVSVQFSENQRLLTLSRGEAYFQVEKNAHRPFVVLTDRSRVTAVGTAFSVDVSDDEGIEVLVTEGRVKVDRLVEHSIETNKAEITDASRPSSPVFLSQGQRASLHGAATEVSYSEDIDSALAWRDGIIVFTGESLQQAVQEIDRYIPLEFKIVDREIASIEVGGYFKTGDLDQLLVIFEQNFGVKSTREGNLILLSKANDG